MATTHEALTSLVGRNNAVQADTSKLFRYVIQRAIPNRSVSLVDQTVTNVTQVASNSLGVNNGVGYNSGNAVVGGRTYYVEAFIPITSTATGVKIDLAGGTATASSASLVYQLYTGAGVSVVKTTTLAAPAANAAATVCVQIFGTFVAATSGSLNVRFSEVANGAGSVLQAGAMLSITELAANV